MGMSSEFIFINETINEGINYNLTYYDEYEHGIDVIDCNGWSSIHNEIIWMVGNYNDIDQIKIDDINYILIPNEKLQNIKDLMITQIEINLYDGEYQNINIDSLEIIDNVIEKSKDFQYVYYQYVY